MTFLSVIIHVLSAFFAVDVNRAKRTYFRKRRLVTTFHSLCSIYIQLLDGRIHTHKWALFPRIHRPCFSLLMKQKLESLHCLTNPTKCLVAVLLVLISKRMGLSGLSEVINIRGHKAMLIEWSPHCYAQGVSLLTPFLSQSFPFRADSPIPFFLLCLSYKSLGDPPLPALAFPTDSSKRKGLVWSGWRSCWESLVPVWIQI